MRRMVISAGLAIALLGASALVLILRTTPGAPVAAREAPARDTAPPPAVGPAEANLGAATPPSSDSPGTAVAPPLGQAAAAAGEAAPPKARSARAAFLAARLRQIPKVQQSPAPAARPAQESLPPEERAAMEARGMDWSKLEQMMRDGVSVEGGAGDAEGAPDPGEG